jgi:hypothetical protein
MALTYDPAPALSDTPVSADWLRSNNEIAASIPRGASTAESRLAAAKREYEVAIAMLGLDFDPRGSGGRGFSPAAGRASPDDFGSDKAGGGRADTSTSYWNLAHEAAYGAGRAYERAIQEARGFETINVGKLRR